jgi:hypothetical protein
MITKSALVASALVLAAAGAQARDVYWSVGINAPLQAGVSVGTVISNGPVYQAAPVYYQPAPVYYQPAPVVYAEPVYVPAPVYVRAAPVVYLPQPYYGPRRVIYSPGWAPAHRGYNHWRHDQPRRGEPVMAGYGR